MGGFVYMGTQRKCWRRRNINLPACERGQWNTESSEFITCLKPSCKPQGQSCESSGDCCDDNVCESFVGGKGKVCVAPPPPPCKQQGQSCENSGDCCDDNVVQELRGRQGQGLRCSSTPALCGSWCALLSCVPWLSGPAVLWRERLPGIASWR